jgi:hypothetical protein
MSSLSTHTTAQPTLLRQDVLLEDILTSVLSPEPASEPPHPSAMHEKSNHA